MELLFAFVKQKKVIRVNKRFSMNVFKRFSLNVFTASKGSSFYILLAIAAAGVVQCRDPKTSPRTPSIVQITLFLSDL